MALALSGRHCCGAALLSWHIARRIIPALEGKQRLPVGAIEEKDEALFGRLGHGVDFLSVTVHGHQDWRRGKIAIPNVVPHSLKMPEALSGLCLQRDQAIGEQIVTDAVSSIKIERRRTGRNIDNPAIDIDGHARPVVGGAAGLPRVLRPRVVSELTGMRNRVERPAQLAACARRRLVHRRETRAESRLRGRRRSSGLCR